KKIANVRIGSMRDDTSDDLRQAIANLQAGGMRGLLLDLRACPGGLLTQAEKIAGLFLPACCIYSTKSRGGWILFPEAERQDCFGVSTTRTTQSGPFRSLLVVVLVNGDTSGGGELIAAALQDNKRALIAGQRTRGKGSIQTLHPISVHGAMFKLTSSILIRPN